MFSPTKTRGASASVLVLLIAACGQQGAESAGAAEAAPDLPLAALERLDAGASASNAAGGDCSLDTINGQPVGAVSLKSGDAATFVGWAGDPGGRVPEDGQLILVGEGGTYGAPVQASIERPDVVAALGKPGLQTSGFSVSTTMDLAPGTYRVSIMMGESEAVVCHFDVSLTLAGAGD